MTNRLKEQYGYKLNYNIKLNKGKTFKITNELDRLKEKLDDYESVYHEEDREAILKKINDRISKKKEALTLLKEEKAELELEKENYDNGCMDKDFDEKLQTKIEEKQERKIMKKAKIQAINEANKGKSQE